MGSLLKTAAAPQAPVLRGLESWAALVEQRELRTRGGGDKGTRGQDATALTVRSPVVFSPCPPLPLSPCPERPRPHRKREGGTRHVPPRRRHHGLALGLGHDG